MSEGNGSEAQRPNKPIDYSEGADGFNREERRLWWECKTQEDRENVVAMQRERRARVARAWALEKWSASEEGRLLKHLGECVQAYRTMLERNPRIAEQGLEYDELNQKIFNRMVTKLERANQAPRCGYTKRSGQQCRAPRVRGKKLCHMHLALEEARPQKISLPNLCDANEIQVAIAKSAQALVDGTLDPKQAGRLGYYLQLALNNIGKVNFEGDEQRAG